MALEQFCKEKTGQFVSSCHQMTQTYFDLKHKKLIIHEKQSCSHVNSFFVSTKQNPCMTIFKVFVYEIFQANLASKKAIHGV